jgi:hypothetical protein
MSHKIHMLSSSPTQLSWRTFNREVKIYMACYTLVRKDGEVELIEGADTYEQEGPLTTFFQVAPDRRVIDCWSVRLMSIRTTEIASIRRESNMSSNRRDAGTESADRVEAAQRCGFEVTGAVG